MTTVLITGVGSEGAYGVIRSLREADPDVRIVGVDTNVHTAHRNFVDAFEVPPLRASTEFIPFIIDRLVKHGCDVCWPIPTDEIEIFARERALIEQQSGARVLTGSLESLQVANDKVRLYRHLQKAGIDVLAPFRVVSDIDSMETAIHELGYPSKRVVIKPARGAGSQGFRILDGSLDRRREYFRRLALQQRARWEDVRPVFAEGGPFPEMLVTSFLPGTEWDVDVLADNGRVITAVTRESHAMFGGMATDAEVHCNSIAAELAVRIAESIGLSFINNIAFKADDDGVLRLLEINPRVPGTIIAATRAGANLPHLAMQLLLTGSVPVVPATRAVRLVRYWDDVVLS